MSEALAFAISLPVAVELIAAAYGPLDFARYPRLRARALARLLVMIALVLALVGWLGAPFAAGICGYCGFFLIKHFANSWFFRKYGANRQPVWTGEETGNARGDK